MGLPWVPVDEEKKCLCVTTEICLLGTHFPQPQVEKLTHPFALNEPRSPPEVHGIHSILAISLRKAIRVVFVFLGYNTGRQLVVKDERKFLEENSRWWRPRGGWPGSRVGSKGFLLLERLVVFMSLYHSQRELLQKSLAGAPFPHQGHHLSGMAFWALGGKEARVQPSGNSFSAAGAEIRRTVKNPVFPNSPGRAAGLME
jgi:hypothetical protein